VNSQLKADWGSHNLVSWHIKMFAGFGTGRTDRKGRMDGRIMMVRNKAFVRVGAISILDSCPRGHVWLDVVEKANMEPLK
jgi:hypothetical protein